ncbi:sialate O-acetylesterase [Pedobacter cryotolerans]|uniref:Sialate O-acetylesterase n=1 Tax=Pedobacter cryotolerans TaxID=2571270 RepID=A0A4U1BWH3_9SPHI|nr:sialate O-acetylesterase [Pedobacter cryotolerans]TKB96639.1 sialate O-acetylesterase [Pedobacter cryotolerans]
MNLPLRHIFLSAFILLLTFTSSAEIKLPQLISNSMVLQRNVKLKIWGWAAVGERVTITFNGKKISTLTSNQNKWLIMLPAMQAGGPYTMSVQGSNKITLTDVLIGDVYFCSGQSNMVLGMERLRENYPNEIKNDDLPNIRNFFVPTKADVTKKYEDLPTGKWKQATKDGILEFGGVTYFFAKKLYQKYKVPIGIINSSVGGTPIEAWMSEEAFNEFPSILAQTKNFKDTAFMNRQKSSISYSAASQSKTTYVPNTWYKFFMPGYWADQGIKNLNGVLYFKREIDVPQSMIGVPAKLYMGRIIDSDSAFVNGVFVGNTTYQYPPRRYNIPANVLKLGKNTILIKVTNTNGKGGFVPEKNYSLQANEQIIDLRGDWLYQVNQVFQQPNNIQKLSNTPQPIVAQSSPTGLYNTMVAPAINYAVKGFLWYQGETNASKPKEYAKLLPALIKDWRAKWDLGDLPFLFAQLPNFMEVDYSPVESDWAQLRQSQLKTLSTPNTGMAVTIDLGEWNDIHPLNKKEIGERLALWADHLAYGNKLDVYSGPLNKSATIHGNKIKLEFDHVGGGLITNDNLPLYHFAILGADKKYVWAKAIIEGNTVWVWNDLVLEPKGVRYGWADNPRGANLYNKNGLPASPFEVMVKK